MQYVLVLGERPSGLTQGHERENALSQMRLLIVFARAYPRRSAVMLTCLLLAALFEGLGLSSLLPVLSIVTGKDALPGADSSQLEIMVTGALAGVGLEPTLGVLLSVLVGAMVVKSGLMIIAQREVGYTVAHVATDLRLELLRALLASRWEYYIRKPVGSLANAFATEAFRASQAYLYGVTIAALFVQVLVYASLAIAASWQATVGAAAVGSFALIALSRLVGMTRRAGTRQTRLMKSLIARLTDVLWAVKPVKAMARERLIAPLLEHETQRLNKALRKEVLSKEALRALQEPLLVGAISLGLFVALSWFAIELDKVILLALLFGRLLGHTNRMQKLYQRMAACDSAFWSLRGAIDQSEEQREQSGGTTVPDLHHAVTLRDVDFAYDDHEVLHDVSIDIPVGKVTVIVGPSGSGKTSVVDLVCGLVSPRAGRVCIDDLPLTDADMTAWRHRIGYVPQETFLLHESVTVNVTLGDPEVERADVETALKAAGAWDFVRVMPEGCDTPVGERGARLSGGQRQRIAIARALINNPQLLILDEATASLDPTSEAEVCDTVRRLRGEVTILAVSHQVALLDVADKVYRIEGGTISEVDAAKYRSERIRDIA